VNAYANDTAAAALDRQIERALADEYFEEALELVRDSLELRIAAVNEDAYRFQGLSDTLDLTSRIVHQSGLAAPPIFKEAVEAYHAATFSLLPEEKLLEHATQVVKTAEQIIVARRYVEAVAACKAAEEIFEVKNSPDQLRLSLPGLVRAVTVRALASSWQGDKENAKRLVERRGYLINLCAEHRISPPVDIFLRLQSQLGRPGG
jgi:hypothetical protein